MHLPSPHRGLRPLLFAVAAFLGAAVFATAATAPAEIPDTIPAGAGNLAFAAHKIRSGQPVRVGFIGGSITQGSGAKNHADCYYWLTKLRLAAFAKTSGSSLDTILAAVGGTGTDYGVYRIGVQLLDKDIDLLVVEFAVNDLRNPGALDGLEGIVRQALARNPRLGIVLFYTVNQTGMESYYDQGTVPPSVEAFHRVAQHYRLAEVQAGPRMQALFRDGGSTPAAFYPDKTHPSKEGHAFYAGLLSDALIAALSAAEAPPARPAPLPAPLGSGQFARARLLPLAPVAKSGDWAEAAPGYYTYVGAWKTTAPGASLTLDVNGERLSLLCGKVGRLRVTGPGFEKVISSRGRPDGIPTLQLLHSGPAAFSGRLILTVEPDAQGQAQAELYGLAVVSPAPTQP